jgi:DNA-binding MurR/RpiR family transcriptional regulator
MNNMGDLQAKSVAPRIRTLFLTLNPLEAQVVSTMLARRTLDQNTSIKSIADESGVSEAMIVKVSKKIGFKGFRDFRAAIAEYNRLPISEMHQELSPADTPKIIIEKVFRTAAKALEETLAILDPEAVERAADLLYRARQRDFYGLGGSAQIALDVAHKFLRIGVRATVYDDAHMMLMSASLLRPGDAIIAFSHSGQTTAVIEAAHLARNSGAKVIAVTNYAVSPLTKEADILLCSTAEGSPLTGENAAARIAQLSILDAVFVAVANKDYAAAERNLERTMSAVRPKRSVTMSSIEIGAADQLPPIRSSKSHIPKKRSD